MERRHHILSFRRILLIIGGLISSSINDSVFL